MTPPVPYPWTLAELSDLYRRLLVRLEKVEGAMSQIRAERTRDTTLLPTWRDVQELKAEIDRLRKRLDATGS
jgi:hypothetical protein